MDDLLKQIKIIFENDDFVAIDKPAGLLVHPTIGHDGEVTLIDWIKNKKPEILKVGENSSRPGIVHRLDRDTSGIMIIAKNNQSFEYLKKLFQERQIEKCYLTLVFGNFKEKSGVIDRPIGRIASSSKHSTKAKKMKDVKEARTEYNVLWNWHKDKEQGFSLIEVYPKTGRTNQIRVHLASIGHSVVGDQVYGSQKLKLPDNLQRMFLHAYFVEFVTKNGEKIHLKAELSKDLQKVLDFFVKDLDI